MSMFAINPDHHEIRRSLRAFLVKYGTDENIRRAAALPPGYDSAEWARIAGELGLPAIGLPEEHGGAGFGFAELVVALDELGAALHPSPLFATRVLAAETLVRSGDESACKRWLPGMACGELTGTLSLAPRHGHDRLEAEDVVAARTAHGFKINGKREHVLDGHTAALVLVTARLSDAVGIFAVERGAAGMSAERLKTLDPTRSQARVVWENTPAVLVGEIARAADVVDAVLDRAAIALGAEQVGGARRCLDMAVEHAKHRVQFGRPIGSFQAVKHLCADVLLELDPATSAVAYAAWAVDEQSVEVPELASLVQATTSAMYVRASATCIQVHGGIGFTWEHPAHLYHRRARSAAVMFGGPTDHRERVLRRIGVMGG